MLYRENGQFKTTYRADQQMLPIRQDRHFMWLLLGVAFFAVPLIAGTPTAHPGQLPPYKSIYAEWDSAPPDWMPEFVALVRTQLDQARAIQNHLFGHQQFVIGQPLWETYLKGEEADPRVALQNAADAVQAEIKRG